MFLISIGFLVLAIIVNQLVRNNPTFMIIYNAIMVALWLTMLVGPIVQNFSFCYVNTIVLEILTYCEFGFMAYFMIFSLISGYILVSLIELSYLSLWFITVYFYYLYTKTLGMGTQLNHLNTEGSYVPPKSTSPTQTTSTHFIIPQSSAIVLTHPDDVVFARDAQNSIVNNVTLPSGIVIPSGDGKNWRVVGNNVILC
jgi:hypothetical protein